MNQEDFVRLAEQYRTPLFRHARNLTGDGHAAEDLVQETLVKAFRHRETLRDLSCCKTWFFTILRNTYHSKRRSLIPLCLDGISEISRKNDEERDWEKIESVQRLLVELPPHILIVIDLYYFQDFSCREIAGLLNIPEGTVKSRAFRGRKILARKL